MDRLSDWDGMEYCMLIFRTVNFIPFSCMVDFEGCDVVKCERVDGS
jgi:hypothetical protein